MQTIEERRQALRRYRRHSYWLAIFEAVGGIFLLLAGLPIALAQLERTRAIAWAGLGAAAIVVGYLVDRRLYWPIPASIAVFGGLLALSPFEAAPCCMPLWGAGLLEALYVLVLANRLRARDIPLGTNPDSYVDVADFD